MNKKIITTAILSTLGTVAHSSTANATLSATASLQFDAGVVSCLANAGTPPDSCSYGTQVNSGSYFGLDSSGSGVIESLERIAIEPGIEGLQVNATQATEGDIDSPWVFLSNLGTHTSISDTTILSDDGTGSVTLDFSGWNLIWNTNFFTLGGGTQDCGTASDNICMSTDINGNPIDLAGIVDNGSGVATITCAIDCSFNDDFTLSYSSTIPFDDPSGFGNVFYELFLTGTVSEVPAPAAVWLFGSGLLALVGVARRRN